jgi:hypothetical protein
MDLNHEETKQIILKWNNQLYFSSFFFQSMSLPIDMNLQERIKTQLGAIRFLDKIITNPYTFCFEKAFLANYKNEFITKLFTQVQTQDPNNILQKDYEEQKIDSQIDTVIDKAENIAVNKGFKDSPRKKIAKFTFPLTCGLLILYMTLQAYAPDVSGYLMIPIFIALCFLPQILRQRIESKWQNFVKENKDSLENENFEIFLAIRKYNQLLLDDLRELLLINKIPLQVFTFYMDSAQYENMIVKDSMNFRGNVQYVVQFEYPPGIEPFPLPPQMQSLQNQQPNSSQAEQSRSPAVQESIDIFHVLHQPSYNSEGQLLDFTQKLVSFETEDLVHDMLNNSTIKKIKDAERVIPFFKRNDKLECQCKEKLILNVLAYNQVNGTNFDYYFVESKKCPICGANNYILFETANNEPKPDQYKKIFE